MNYFYWDTSALVKRYHSEPGSTVVNQLFKLKSEEARFLTVSWTLVEFEAAFDQIKRRGAGLTDQHIAIARADFYNDLSRFFVITPVDDSLVRAAIPLPLKHGLASADALQLAAALHDKTQISSPDKFIFLCADARLGAAARAEGLTTIDPRDPRALSQIRKATR